MPLVIHEALEGSAVGGGSTPQIPRDIETLGDANGELL
jgi:hypothetical protein